MTTRIEEPANPVAAVVHPDPYPYHSRLVRDRPLYRDPALGLWVASSAAAATAVLSNPACRVRPPDEPVPRSLLGSHAADLFGRLIRMTDGRTHDDHKRAIGATLDSLDPTWISRTCDRWTAHLASGRSPDSTGLMEFAFATPVHVVGSLVGFADSSLSELTTLVERFVACLSPMATPEQLERGKAAAADLWEHGRALGRSATGESGILQQLVAHSRQHRDDPEALWANAVGLMIQSYEATAGLIATTLTTLTRSEPLRRRILSDPTYLAAVVDEVLRFDSPVQNTRRFVTESVMIDGHSLSPGDAILVVLAAANRDPSANSDPDRFDTARRDRRDFTFGLGPHACPGRAIATSIATTAVGALITNGLDPARLEPHVAYRPSVNTRIPILRICDERGAR